MNAVSSFLDRFDGGSARRWFTWLAVSLAIALLVSAGSHVPSEAWQVGEVATRTVRAPMTFSYVDADARQSAVAEARATTRPVFEHRADLGAELRDRVVRAFAAGRASVAAGEAASTAAFADALGVHVPAEDIAPLVASGFVASAETLCASLVERSMSAYVVGSRDELPADGGGVTVIALRSGQREEFTLSDLSALRTPNEAREQVNLALWDLAKGEVGAEASAAAAVARAMIRPNISFVAIETEERLARAEASVASETRAVKRGTILFREGDVLTAADVERYRALQAARGPERGWIEFAATALFVLLLLAGLYGFGASYLPGFATQTRDVVAGGVLLVLVAAFARLFVDVGEQVAAWLGPDAEASAVWFAVPVAGAAMLVRLLIGVPWTIPFVVAAAATCGLMMELRALHVLYFVLVSLAAMGAVHHTRERLAVLRAGLFAGLSGVAVALLVHAVQPYVGGAELGVAGTMRPAWSMVFAFLGGFGSAFLALGLMPLFEAAGFVTDYRLMELASLNHPLMRELMLRAPGSYHHSVMVGTLAEAGCQAIGANALLARVAAYFHDIGKAGKPQYFIENQRGNLNRHDGLDPYTSARVIIAHVTEGGRKAREHNLPKPIIDNIYMHHGTGLLPYFVHRARTQATDPASVDESAFRYPGPKPDTREAGVIMLADKVEAATRTVAEPSEDAFRALIQQIINSVMADGQFDRCPLTFQELYTIADTFVTVLVGIHHQRIEYPEQVAMPRRSATITLEMPTPRPLVPRDDELPSLDDETGDPSTDYESVHNLPGGGP